jgi:hypothetical protein
MTRTNRELYELVRSFRSKFGDRFPPLEIYLSSLWRLVSQAQPAPLSWEQLAIWLEQAFTEAPPPFDPAWLQRHPNFKEGLTSYEDWEDRILFQIADLRRMVEAGLLEDEQRYFGLNSPSRSRWYNFEPLTYLECGVRGTVGGYKEDEVIVLIPPPPGESADSAIEALEPLTWEMFIAILESGQWYE